MRIDLHSHSDASDGTLPPAAIVTLARESDIDTLAITDHDTFAGYDGALPTALRLGVDLVCGIEISASSQDQSIHLLGYFFEVDRLTSLREWIKQLHCSRIERNLHLAARLRDLGLEITIEEVTELGRGVAGRPHFAQLLVKKGYVSSIKEAFDSYLGYGARGYVPLDQPNVVDVIHKIREAKGIASLAHPVRVKSDIAQLLRRLSDSGLEAIETYHSDHTVSQTRAYIRLARRYDLLRTGGSDFHGAIKPDINLGTGRRGNLTIPREILRELRNYQLGSQNRTFNR